MSLVVAAGCVLCRHLGYGHVECGIHHPRIGQGKGQRASHYLAIGLCPEHHQGAGGIHGLGSNAFYLRYRLDELDLLAMTVHGVVARQF